jgi:beta-N-acetylhexosaminidase
MNPEAFTLEQLAGQRLLVGFEGKQFNQDLEFLIRDLKVGGLILFSHNLETPDQIKKLCESVQEFARNQRQPFLIIAIDQEGGQVARLGEPFTQFPGNSAMRNIEDAVYFAETTAAELAEVGINMNLAPVMDVVLKETNSIMTGRSFGHDPDWVASMGVTVINCLQHRKIMAVAKHFPGIGRTTADSHIDLPTCDGDLTQMKNSDLPPFKACIDNAVAGIMLSHIVYKKIDPKWPASLSQTIAHQLLRKQLGFQGVSMTDDLDMGAIGKHYDIQTVIRQILLADIDLVLICHKGPNIEYAYQEILQHIKNSKELRASAIESVGRIMNLKRKYLGI